MFQGYDPSGSPNAKFTSYGFDVSEFMHLVSTGATSIKEHPEYIVAHKLLHGCSHNVTHQEL